MAEYSANAVQTVAPGETVIFDSSVFPCRKGNIRHRDGTGLFLLSGRSNNFYGCPCNRNSVNYNVDFGANIAIAEGGTVEPISVAITLDGVTLPATEMIITPAAVEEYGNVSRASGVPIWANCCETIAVRNTSNQPILVQNANIVITR